MTVYRTDVLHDQIADCQRTMEAMNCYLGADDPEYTKVSDRHTALLGELEALEASPDRYLTQLAWFQRQLDEVGNAVIN